MKEKQVYLSGIVQLFVAFILSVSLSFASVTSDVGVNVSIGQAVVLVINYINISPDDIPIENPANFSIEVSNIGNIDGNASSFIQIYNGYTVIDSFSSQSFIVPVSPSNVTNISVIHTLNYPIGNYTALGYINYNNKTLGPVYKNFTINRGQPPTIHLVSPSNHSWTHLSNDTLEFMFYVDDVDSSHFECSLYLDGFDAGQNLSVSRLTNTSIKSNISFTNGVHSWFIRCKDAGDNVADSETWEINIGSFCSVLDVDDLYYYIEEDLYSDQTCFTITGRNVTLDCQGNSIFFNSGSAIRIQGENAVVKNCNLIQNQSLPATGIQIAADGGNSSLMNNNVTILGDNSTGLRLESGNLEIINNSISLYGSNSYSLYLENSSSNIFSNNSFLLNSSSSRFIYSDVNSNGNSFTNNEYVPPAELEGFSISIYVNQSGLNTTIPAAARTPELGLFIPEHSVSDLTQLNITTRFSDRVSVPINIASNQGVLLMLVNVTSSAPVSADPSNPITLTINSSSLNLSSSEESRLGIYLYNESSSRWESLATQCNLTSHICITYLTHFSSYGWIFYIPQAVTKEKETRQVSLSGTLSCTKEMAHVITEPNASIEVRFLEQPYANSLIKVGNADENGSFVFIADLPGRYQVYARKSGFADNSFTLTAADDCIPRITFVRKWLTCSLSSCSIEIPVLTTQMKNVAVDLTDVYSIMSGSLVIKDKYGSNVNYYSFVGKELNLPLITDSFKINSQSSVQMKQINDFANGRVNLTFSTSSTARVSGFVLNIDSIGNNYINNITYISDKEYPLTRYTIDGNKITIDHQLYLYPNSRFVLSVSPVPLRCKSNEECPSDSICQDGTCTVISCSCGYIINRSCIPYECCADSDCAAGKSCISHLCVYTPPTITEDEKRYIADRLNVLIVSIQSAREQGEDVTTASQLLDQARTAYEAGNFEKAKELLAQAQQIFTIGRETPQELPVGAIITAVVLILVVVFAYIVISRLSSSKPWKAKKKK